MNILQQVWPPNWRNACWCHQVTLLKLNGFNLKQKYFRKILADELIGDGVKKNLEIRQSNNFETDRVSEKQKKKVPVL